MKKLMKKMFLAGFTLFAFLHAFAQQESLPNPIKILPPLFESGGRSFKDSLDFYMHFTPEVVANGNLKSVKVKSYNYNKNGKRKLFRKRKEVITFNHKGFITSKKEGRYKTYYTYKENNQLTKLENYRGKKLVSHEVFDYNLNSLTAIRENFDFYQARFAREVDTLVNGDSYRQLIVMELISIDDYYLNEYWTRRIFPESDTGLFLIYYTPERTCLMYKDGEIIDTLPNYDCETYALGVKNIDDLEDFYGDSIQIIFNLNLRDTAFHYFYNKFNADSSIQYIVINAYFSHDLYNERHFDEKGNLKFVAVGDLRSMVHDKYGNKANKYNEFTYHFDENGRIYRAYKNDGRFQIYLYREWHFENDIVFPAYAFEFGRPSNRRPPISTGLPRFKKTYKYAYSRENHSNR